MEDDIQNEELALEIEEIKKSIADLTKKHDRFWAEMKVMMSSFLPNTKFPVARESLNVVSASPVANTNFEKREGISHQDQVDVVLQESGCSHVIPNVISQEDAEQENVEPFQTEKDGTNSILLEVKDNEIAHFDKDKTVESVPYVFDQMPERNDTPANCMMIANVWRAISSTTNCATVREDHQIHDAFFTSSRLSGSAITNHRFVKGYNLISQGVGQITLPSKVVETCEIQTLEKLIDQKVRNGVVEDLQDAAFNLSIMDMKKDKGSLEVEVTRLCKTFQNSFQMIGMKKDERSLEVEVTRLYKTSQTSFSAFLLGALEVELDHLILDYIRDLQWDVYWGNLGDKFFCKALMMHTFYCNTLMAGYVRLISWEGGVIKLLASKLHSSLVWDMTKGHETFLEFGRSLMRSYISSFPFDPGGISIHTSDSILEDKDFVRGGYLL